MSDCPESNRSNALPTSDACCGDEPCSTLPRREFLKVVGVGGSSLLLGGSSALARGMGLAGSAEAHGVEIRHYIPADKRLSAEWLRSLVARGEPRVLRGSDLDRVGMPVGGIAAGQMYLCGDGTLGEWKIDNQLYFSGYGRDNYQVTRMPERPVEHGFAVAVESGDDTRVRRLDANDFPEAEFRGEYPIARVRYADDAFPLRIEMEAFSPFIPLNANDSTLPATVIHLDIENVTDAPVRVSVLTWIENAILRHSADRYKLEGQRLSRVLLEPGRTTIEHVAHLADEDATRPAIPIADFEGGSYGDWTVQGEAFGDKPAGGTLPSQNPVSGFEGKGLVNTFFKGDATRGRLTSPDFKIERKYVNFLIGGGKHAAETYMNLVIDGGAVSTATGRDEERLHWQSWDVREFAGKTARIEIVDEHSGAWGHVNVDQIELSDQRRFETAASAAELEDNGSMVLAIEAKAVSKETVERLLAALKRPPAHTTADGATQTTLQERQSTAIASEWVELPAHKRTTITLVLAWNFPNREHGQMYANRFQNAESVAGYVFENHDRLAEHTRLWRDTFYDSTLPVWLLDRLGATGCILATGTCQWWGDGRFWAWEGVGCCAGTCTHVWNYAHALARLFPSLERSVREMQDLGEALHDDGLVGFRGQHNGWYAADGQVGTVLKCYREHLMSADDSFLKRNWPKIRRVLEYSIKQDANDDGLIENSQHNTFDINFEGANTFVGSLYLAALRAGEAMARELGEVDIAERLHKIFDSGQRLSVERLFNGEYFIQQVDLHKHPKYQYGDGCLSDQLFGQGWAHQLALGHIYPPEHVRTALESVWKYNWAPDVGPQNAVHKPERWFASPGEGGLFTCTWPRSEHLEQGVRYRNEVWTGIEYQVAGHMIAEGMVEQGLAICRAVHDRYDASKHNPYNEIECGDHYARAMASWGVFLALCGYEYHGPQGRLAFAPRLTPDDFRTAFTTAAGWGTFEQKREGRRQSERIELRWGELRLRSLAFELEKPKADVNVTLSLNEKPIEVGVTVEGSRVTIRFAEDVQLKAGQSLLVEIV